MAVKIKKGDEVEVIAGKNKGDRGKVLHILPRKRRVLVEGINIVKKHQKAMQNREGGILDQEAPLAISNIMVVDPSDNRPCRVGFTIKDGVKKRVSRRTGTPLD
jgi:large subunit ribosomal protein L24